MYISRLRFVYATSESQKPRGIAGFLKSIAECVERVSATRDSMAERVGLEPAVPLQIRLISNQARSTELGRLSAGAQTSNLGGVLGSLRSFVSSDIPTPNVM